MLTNDRAAAKSKMAEVRGLEDRMRAAVDDSKAFRVERADVY